LTATTYGPNLRLERLGWGGGAVDDNHEGNVFRGLLIALPISLALWGVILLMTLWLFFPRPWTPKAFSPYDARRGLAD
jgi:hypothetical protein